MSLLEQKFERLGVDNAPGQEVRQRVKGLELRGEKLTGVPVDFSHGDVDAFEPIPGTLDLFIEGVHAGGRQAYTEYRGDRAIREDVAQKLSRFTGQAVDADEQLILTPGTQAALFLAMAAAVGQGDKVAILEPDYFANRKLVFFFDGELAPIHLDYLGTTRGAGLGLKELEESFKAGVNVFLFSNPNNPTGVIYSADEIRGIAELANKYGVTVIADELYSRQVFEGREYTHLCSQGMDPDKLVTIIGPSKTESLSGYRLGVAFGSPQLIARMEKLQAIVSLRAPGYSQAVLKAWFNEPEGWIKERIAAHQKIRDDLFAELHAAGLTARATEAGSYLFAKLPKLDVSLQDFVKILRIHADVVVTPGTEFGQQFTDCFRINFSQDREAAVAAIKRLTALIERYRT